MAGASHRHVLRGAGLGILCGLLLMTAACERVRSFQWPEVETCGRFIQSRMKSPGSYERRWSNVADLPVTRAMLADATGSSAAANAPNPAIRNVFIQFRGSDNEGKRVIGVGLCRFGLIDSASSTYAQDIEASVTRAVQANEQRVLAASLGAQNATAADCCLRDGFDLAKLAAIKPIQRGKVPTARKM